MFCRPSWIICAKGSPATLRRRCPSVVCTFTTTSSWALTSIIRWWRCSGAAGHSAAESFRGVLGGPAARADRDHARRLGVRNPPAAAVGAAMAAAAAADAASAGGRGLDRSARRPARRRSGLDEELGPAAGRRLEGVAIGGVAGGRARLRRFAVDLCGENRRRRRQNRCRIRAERSAVSSRWPRWWRRTTASR